MPRVDSLWGVSRVWLRFFDVFTKGVWYYLVTTFLEPILYLLSFGLGVGSLVGDVTAAGHQVSYRAFIFSGIIAQTVLFQGFMEGAYGGFVRMYYQRIFQAIAVTPITLSEVLWGELLWDTTKATAAAEVVVIIGVVAGDFPPLALVTVLPLALVSALLFSALGLAAAAYARSIEQMSYPQYLLVFPMFLFCGVFYPLEKLPPGLQILAWCLPLTSVTSLAHSLALGFPIEARAFPILLGWMTFLVAVSRRAMIRRLVK
ncbi:MAG TPA: ABC transporter permease [Kofleriaceae bacterium]|nr:ABC transporter permease [Kofleriaceae bacterium]